MIELKTVDPETEKEVLRKANQEEIEKAMDHVLLLNKFHSISVNLTEHFKRLSELLNLLADEQNAIASSLEDIKNNLYEEAKNNLNELKSKIEEEEKWLD